MLPATGRRPREPVRLDRLYKTCAALPSKHRALKCKKTATLSLLFFDFAPGERYRCLTPAMQIALCAARRAYVPPH